MVHINLKSAHNKYIVAENNHTTAANRNQPGAWEAFDAQLIGNSTYVHKYLVNIKSSNLLINTKQIFI